MIRPDIRPQEALMDRKTVLAAAGAMVLTVVGGISALAVAFGGAPADSGSSASLDGTSSTVVVTEYVDEFGNPVAAPGTAVASGTAFTYTPTPQFEDPSPSRGTLPPDDSISALGGGTSADTSSPGSQYEGSDDDQYEGSDDQYEGSDDQYESHDHEDEHEGGDD
jgi:hypothetical protein